MPRNALGAASDTTFPSEDEPAVPRRRGDHGWQLAVFVVFTSLLTLSVLAFP